MNSVISWFTSLLILSCGIVTLAYASTCPILQCSDSINACHETSGSVVKLNPGYCDGDSKCYYYDGFRHSLCTKNYDIDTKVFLYPGYYCDNYSGAKCVFGDKVCSTRSADGKTTAGTCTGKHIYDLCERHSDCYYGHFCEQGKCIEEVGIGSYCQSHEACGRKGFCLHSDAALNFGYCVEYVSVESSSTTPVLAYEGGVYLYQDNAEKVCKSGWIDRTTGRCATALKSLRKGQACTSDIQCTTSDPSVYASCKCSLNGSQLCDILGGDSEWIEAFDKFQSYLKVTEDFHSAEVLGQCMETPEYKDWFCSEFEANHYVELLTKPSCFERVMEFYHEYAEYHKTCIDFAYLYQIQNILLISSLLVFLSW